MTFDTGSPSISGPAGDVNKLLELSSLQDVGLIHSMVEDKRFKKL